MKKELSNKYLFKLPRKLNILLNLAKIDLKNGSFSNFERRLGYYSPQPDVRDILKLLVKSNILILDNHISNTDVFTLELDKLNDYILNLEELKDLFKFYEDNHTIVV